MAEEFTVGIEVDVYRTGGIAGQLPFGDGDTVINGPFLTAHVEEQKGDSGEFLREVRDEIIQPVQAADGGKGRVTLRRITQRDGAVALEFARSPAGDLTHDRGMRDDGKPAIFVLGLAGVVLLHPVRLDDDTVTRRDKVGGKFERVDGGFNLLTQRVGIVIAGFAAEDRDFGGAERGRGERVHRNADYLRAACSLCNAAAALESLA